MGDQVTPLTFINAKPERDRVTTVGNADVQFFVQMYARAFPNDPHKVIHDDRLVEVQPRDGGRLEAELEDMLGRLMGMEKSEDAAFAARCCRYLLGYLNGKGMPDIDETEEFHAGRVSGLEAAAHFSETHEVGLSNGKGYVASNVYGWPRPEGVGTHAGMKYAEEIRKLK